MPDSERGALAGGGVSRQFPGYSGGFPAIPLRRFRVLPFPLTLFCLGEEPHLGWFAFDPWAFLMSLLHSSCPFVPRSERAGGTVGETSGHTYPDEMRQRIKWRKRSSELRGRWRVFEQ